MKKQVFVFVVILGLCFFACSKADKTEASECLKKAVELTPNIEFYKKALAELEDEMK